MKIQDTFGEEKSKLGTNIRPDISLKNKYWINRHRYYELKHFCMQYTFWKKAYAALNEPLFPSTNVDKLPGSKCVSDITSKQAVARAYYDCRIKMVEQAAEEADEELKDYILKAVTEGLSYANLKSRLDIPCGKDMYYDRYRKFFWVLSELRE